MSASSVRRRRCGGSSAVHAGSATGTSKRESTAGCTASGRDRGRRAARRPWPARSPRRHPARGRSRRAASTSTGAQRGGLAIDHRPALEDGEAARPRRLHELAHEARLAHARLAHQRHDLALPRFRALERLAQQPQLRVPAHEGVRPRAAAACSRAAPAPPPPPRTLPPPEPSPHGNGPARRHREIPSVRRCVSSLRRMLPGRASFSIRAARWVVWPTAV